MKILVEPTFNREGEVTAPPSKSHTHRAATIALLASGKTTIDNPLKAGDTLATLNACKLFGAKILEENERWVISPPRVLVAPKNPINAVNSGTTIRFMTAIAVHAEGETILTGTPSLQKRPMQPLIDALNSLGAECESVNKNGFPPVRVKGKKIKGGYTKIPGSISSQFISALLISLPLAQNDTTIEIIGELKSKPYVEMTIKVMDEFGVHVYSEDKMRRFIIPGGQKYKGRKYRVPGDFSSATFLMAAAVLTNSTITVKGLNFDVPHADKFFIDVLKKMGANIELDYKEGCIKVKPSGRLTGIQVNCKDSPDLIPILSVTAAYAEGKTLITGAEHVRYKESNRLKVMTEELLKMGANIKETEDGLEIEGKKQLTGSSKLEAHGDHRVFMALTIAALAAEGKSLVNGYETAKDSYPSFLEDLKLIGFKVSKVE
ncbi:MAG: 3-phosphoshikimate 1-carboxyvinyltransferase [Candidatus Odinarchaeia archaeon]